MFAKIFTEAGKPLPAITAIHRRGEQFRHQVLVALFPIVWAAALRFFAWKTPNGKFAIDKFLYDVPIFGPIIRKVAVSRFTRTFGTLIESGVSIVPALEIVERAVGNAVVTKALGQARIGISQGQGMARPLAETKVFRPCSRRWWPSARKPAPWKKC